MIKTAWGDESIRMVAQPPVYLLAASFFTDSDESNIDELERIKPAGAKKLHWMDMNTKLRKASLSALASLPMVHTVVVASPLNGRKQERARRKALEVLLPTLEQRGIELLVLESRGPLNDKRDINLLLSMRRKQTVVAIDLQHEKGDSNSRLWVPDQVLGAYGDRASLSGGAAAGEWPKLEERIEVLEVEL